MKTFKQIKDTNDCAKLRLKKLSTSGKYYGMEKSKPDKTNFNRLPYYLTVGKKISYVTKTLAREMICMKVQ